MSISQLLLRVQNWIFPKVNISLSVIKQQIVNDVNNFKTVFKIFIFTCNRAIEHNIQYLLEFKMSVYQLWLCVHNWDFEQVNISFCVIKQKIINDVQQF